MRIERIPEKNVKHGWKGKIKVWVSVRCQRCKRFIARKPNATFCDKCAYLNKLVNNRKFNRHKYHSDPEYRKREILRVDTNRRNKNLQFKREGEHTQ